MAIFKVLLLFMGCALGQAEARSWYSQPPKGWLWYQKQPPPKLLKSRKEKQPPQETHTSPENAVTSYQERMREVRENLEEIQAKAILEPTRENVRAFQRAQNAVWYQAEAFQNMLMLAALEDRTYPADVALRSPVGRELYQKEAVARLDAAIQKLAKTYGVFFIFKQDCPYCHQFSPILREWMDTYGFDAQAISPDGSALPEFPETVTDNGAIATLNPEGMYPAAFLVNPHTREVIPLAHGLLNTQQLTDNCRVIIDYLNGRDR